MRSALQLSKRVQAQGEAKPKQKSSLLYPPFSFLRERKGFYLRSACSYERSEVERRLPLRRATHSQLPKADPLPNPLQPHCTLEVAALRAGLNLALSHRKFESNLMFSRYRSRRVKFESKFEYKRIRRRFFAFRRDRFKFYDGSYLVR